MADYDIHINERRKAPKEIENMLPMISALSRVPEYQCRDVMLALEDMKNIMESMMEGMK